MGVFSRGQERGPSESERQKQQSNDRMEDVNASTRREVTMADLRERRG